MGKAPVTRNGLALATQGSLDCQEFADHDIMSFRGRNRLGFPFRMARADGNRAGQISV